MAPCNLRAVRLELMARWPDAFALDEVARRVHVSLATLRTWERGASRPADRRSARRLARDLGSTVAELWPPAPPRRKRTRPAQQRTDQQGYLLVKRPGHPLANASGWVFQHRAVLYRAIGNGSHACHWCGRLVRWDGVPGRDDDALVVDHLDGRRKHNKPANLVPSCGPCNTHRRWQ